MIYDTKLGVGGDDTAADLVHWSGASHWGSAQSGAAKEADSVTGIDPDESEESRETAAILIVEDEALNALYISSVLEVCGYDVIGVTATAAEALDLAAGHVPDLVLMDITLRGEVDGIAAARSLQERLGVPILFVTAHADAPTLARARAINPAGYLLKPFTAHQLETAVRKALASA
jgi:CheY-like chemotaxis protein